MCTILQLIAWKAYYFFSSWLQKVSGTFLLFEVVRVFRHPQCRLDFDFVVTQKILQTERQSGHYSTVNTVSVLTVPFMFPQPKLHFFQLFSSAALLNGQ